MSEAGAEEFEIKEDGYHPHAGDGFSYKDGAYQFWFYTDVLAGSEGYQVVVKNASIRRFGGPPPVVSLRELPTIERRICEYFDRVDYFGRTSSVDRCRGVTPGAFISERRALNRRPGYRIARLRGR